MKVVVMNIMRSTTAVAVIMRNKRFVIKKKGGRAYIGASSLFVE